MRLLFDQNLSPRLVSRLRDCFPEASHVSMLGLDAASDLAVWNYARDGGFTIVTKDADFNDAAILRGIPPKLCGFGWGIAPHELLKIRYAAIE